jgi:menaquinone-9 beta-reductase
MLCGDAAALIDPASGEGIGQSMISGRYAGWQAIKCFKQSNFSADFMKQYDKQLYDKLWKAHRKHYLIQQFVLNKEWLFSALFSLVLRSRLLTKLVLRSII